MIKYMVLAVAGLIASFTMMPDPQFYEKDNDPKRELVKQVETDSIQYELWLLYDNNDTPAQFMAEIFTPVCYSNKCYPVYIDFFWDLLGNYQYYKVPKGEMLTKNDHEPFTKDDYEHLQRILQNESSLLGEYAAEDLVSSTESESPTGVDAVTGATSKTIQNEVISGAVYSCYTLWHIAHGEITDSILSHTESTYSEEDIVRFLASENHKYQYWALDKIFKGDLLDKEKYAAPVLNILRGKNIFISQYLIEKLPKEMFAGKERQQWLWETYLISPYRLQLSLLDKLKLIELESEVELLLIGQLETSNKIQKEKIFDILNEQKLADEAKSALSAYLERNGDKEKVLEILNNQ